MKAGDLVVFQSSFKKFMIEYENRSPGIIVGVGTNSATVRVLWATGEFTHEHAAYVNVINEGQCPREIVSQDG